jgi:hypothetical protein
MIQQFCFDLIENRRAGRKVVEEWRLTLTDQASA